MQTKNSLTFGTIICRPNTNTNLCHIWGKSNSYCSLHAGMFAFGSQILVPKVYEYIRSGHTVRRYAVSVQAEISSYGYSYWLYCDNWLVILSIRVLLNQHLMRMVQLLTNLHFRLQKKRKMVVYLVVNRLLSVNRPLIQY
jgi:hypothetical protein